MTGYHAYDPDDRSIVESRHRAVQDVMRHFTYDHLPPNLQAVSKPICELAHRMLALIPEDDPELTRGLHKLIEAKDALVRAAIPK